MPTHSPTSYGPKMSPVKSIPETAAVRPLVDVVILEDQLLFRQCLARSLSESARVRVRGVFADVESLLADSVAVVSSHVALLDVRLGKGDAFGVVEGLRRLSPSLRMIWLTSIAEDFLLEQAFAAKLPGFVHKDDSLDILLQAVETVASGGRYYSEAALRLREKSRSKSDRYSLILSDREQEVLRLIGAGFSNAEAASLLSLSADTVKTHRRNIMARLGLHSALELQTYALKIGLVDPKGLRPAGAR